MTAASLPHRRFSLADQLAFAELSGDANPMHVDALLARRLMYGKPVAHGIHVVLWALETLLAQRGTPRSLASLVVRFVAPVLIDTDVELAVTDRTDAVKLTVTAAGRPAVDITVRPSDSPSSPWDGETALPRTRCRERERSTLAGSEGEVPLHLPPRQVADLFPALARSYAPEQLAVLLATTRLVGMECPGLNSMFSEINLVFPAVPTRSLLSWRVQKYDDRFSLAVITVDGPATGTLSAFVRPAPVLQPSYGDLAGRMPAGSLAGQRALVVGGSRGLGEITAKMLATGGADVLLTYHVGKTDAEAVVADIRAGGGRASCMPLDITAPSDLPATLPTDWWPTHLYYFATPPISVSARGGFSADLFFRFTACYVAAFHAVVNILRTHNKGSLTVLYPSTVFVTEPPVNMSEYTAAKAAGEVVCRCLAAADRNLDIRVHRFPRLPTDQTAAMVPVPMESPIELFASLLPSLATSRAAS